MKKSLRIYGLFLLTGAVSAFSLFGGTLALAVTTLIVPEQVTVSSDMIVLGAIAEIEGGDAALGEKLQSVVLGKAPSPGEKKSISADYIESKIRQRGIDLDSVALRLPEEIEVARAAIVVSPHQVEEIVRGFILKKMGGDRNLVSIKISPVESISLPAGKMTYEITPRRNENYLGNITLGLVFLVDGKVEKKIWVSAEIDVSRTVVVCTRAIQRNQVISQDDIRLEAMSLKNLPRDVVTEPHEVIGKRAQRTIDANSPLRSAFLEVMPLVKRGDVVMIVAESDAVKITTQGVAIENGAQGEMVRVVNTGSQKEIYGVVKDSKTVVVDF